MSNNTSKTSSSGSSDSNPVAALSALSALSGPSALSTLSGSSAHTLGSLASLLNNNITRPSDDAVISSSTTTVSSTSFSSRSTNHPPPSSQQVLSAQQDLWVSAPGRWEASPSTPATSITATNTNDSLASQLRHLASAHTLPASSWESEFLATKDIPSDFASDSATVEDAVEQYWDAMFSPPTTWNWAKLFATCSGSLSQSINSQSIGSTHVAAQRLALISNHLQPSTTSLVHET
ncbi:hypothetical protein BASA50_000807 [Batrachochytrium salamandrivorans]|uniref:Uncharacterized protein n=1 Tax=Batrachochytrium salamandrivorans TaxID=1357716 RepID=A0ABQ8EVI2_9FUNG|nr:hypothetical protein BASA62_000134 [Batrachochytrium salamandrivorans]KAH6586102.1 hypothetical protein BASA50_000807 [Batrachochytrium salamandrivorans]KAH9247161.1 hypothetical protein BASA81_015245 [Batrachochytrium salamandrivorans]KAJ1339928.1 hypothetical protein BSLG_005463 [Batrachochytrium salamandrivorans]